MALYKNTISMLLFA